MYKIPKSITILGRKFKVISNIPSSKMKIYGECNFTDRIIRIRESSSQEEAYITFLHECVHVVHFITGINQTLDSNQKEIICESTANMIIDIIKSLK